MPDFMPMIWKCVPTIAAVLVFVGVVQFIVFVRRRWSKAA